MATGGINIRRMSRPRPPAWICRLLLLCYCAMLGAGTLAPMVTGSQWQVVCLGSGGVKLVATDQGSDSDGGMTTEQAMSCPLCQPATLPPVHLPVARLVQQPLQQALRPAVVARLTAIAGAPLPARGPPAA